MPNANLLLRVSWVLAIAVGGCGATLGQGVSDRAGAQPLAVGEGCHDDPSSIDGAELSGGTLYLQLRHGGGCAEHEYTLCPSDRILESDPAQWDLFVVHDAHDDECRAMISATYRVDESELGHRIADLQTIDGRRIRVTLQE
jgi:hypothetical protein